MARRSVIAITSGEPAGIGPELCAMLSSEEIGARLVVIGDAALVSERALACGRHGPLRPYQPAEPPTLGQIEILDRPLATPSIAGRLDPRNAPYVIGLLDSAVQGCLRGEFDAMVTAPVQKSVINDGGLPFTGHTEYLAKRANNARVVMMLVGGGMRVALATTHLPLSQVAGAIRAAALCEILQVIDRDLRIRFGIDRPRILVSGLNPHSGEAGHLGREEIEVIAPALAQARAEGIDAEGPIAADTLFVPHRLQNADCVLAMYHDQGLPVLKYASFGRGVNVTLGLPYIRTSVDHGTALDLAGRGRADPGSLLEAVRLAVELAQRARRPVDGRRIA